MSRRYQKSHEWAREDGAEIEVGLSAFAAGEVGDVIHVELPALGSQVARGTAMAEIESVKSVNDVYAPVDGEVVAVNTALEQQPDLVNQQPEGAGWLVRIRPSAADPLAELLDSAAYQALLGA